MRQTGFTLIELMVVVAIAAVVLMIGIPSFSASIKNSAVQTSANTFFTSLVLARSEAVKRNQPAIICKSADGANCTTSGNWESGWVVFADADGDGDADSDEVIRSYSALANQVTLRSNTSAQNNRLTYRPDGTITTAGTFRVCHDNDTQWGRSVVVSVTGRARRDDAVDSCP